jgi:hypothetical protein
LTHATRRLPIIVIVILGLSVTACGAAASTAARPTAATPSAPSASVTAPPASPTATIAPTTAPSASAADVACDLTPQTGTLPSDRLTGMQVLGVPGTDIVRFEFSPGSLTPAGPPVGSLDVATPPFTEGASGLPVKLEGEHALQVVFRGMSLQNDVGQETYTGEREIRADDPSRSLRHVVIFDESEGQMGFYLGYDGASCVTLSREGDNVIVAIAFGPGS